MALRDGVTIEALDRLLGTAEWPSIGRLLVEDDLRKDTLGAPARVGLGLQQVVEPLIAQPLDLGLRECWLQDHLGQQCRPRRPKRERGTSRVAVSASHEASAWSSAPSRSEASMKAMASRLVVPFGQRPAGHRRHTGQLFGLGRAAAGHDQVRRQQRAPRHVRRQHGQPVVQAERVRTSGSGSRAARRPMDVCRDVKGRALGKPSPNLFRQAARRRRCRRRAYRS